jgi:hypothetical protein
MCVRSMPCRCCLQAEVERLTAALERVRPGAAQINAAKTHCPRGHQYDESNTEVDKRGWRRCKACRKESDAARYQALRGESDE